ncbi:MAG TPA: J domain-containing protein [bacterium]|nr:J domain-containing protein [bacterium]
MGTGGRIQQSLYELLGVSPRASDDDIKKAYKTLARKYHPDLNQGNAQAEMMFKAVGRAFEVLGDPEKRAAYDARLEQEHEEAMPPKPAGRKVDLVLVTFTVMLIMAMIFFFVDTPKGIYFLLVAVALEVRTAIESLRNEVRSRK